MKISVVTLPTINLLFKDPHLNNGIEFVGKSGASDIIAWLELILFTLK